MKGGGDAVKKNPSVDELVREVDKKMGRPIFTPQGKHDARWINEHINDLVQQYANRWIAVYRGEVIAVGASPEEVIELARKRRGKQCRPVVHFVEGGPYVY